MEKPVIGTEIGQYLFGAYHNGDDVRVRLLVQIPPDEADEDKLSLWQDEHSGVMYTFGIQSKGTAVFHPANHVGEDYYMPLFAVYERDDVKAAIIALATAAQVSYPQKSLAEALAACYAHYIGGHYLFAKLAYPDASEKQDGDARLPDDYPRLVNVYGIGKKLVLVSASDPEKAGQRFKGVITSAQIFTSVRQNGTLLMLDTPHVRFAAAKKVGHKPSFVALVRLNTTAHPGADQVCWENVNVDGEYWVDARQYPGFMGDQVLKNIKEENPKIDWSVWQ